MTRRRDLYLVVAARFISRAGGEAAFFVGVWGKAAYQLNGSAGQIAAVMGALALATIAGTTVAGVLVDRFDPRRVLIGAEALFVPVALAVAFADSIPTLIALVALLGFVGAPVMTAIAAMPPFMTDDPADLERLNAWIEGAGAAAFVIGPGAGAVIAGYASLEWVFVLDAVTSLAAVFLVWPVHLRPRERTSAPRPSPIAEMREGLRVSYASRGLRYYILIGSAMWLGFGAFGALEPLFYRDVLHEGVETIGWVNVVFGLGMVAGSALLTRLPRRIVSAAGLALMACLTGFGALLYVGTSDLRIVVAGAIVWGVVIGVTDPLLRTLIQSDSPDELVGRISGTAMMHHQAGELIPLAIAPALAGVFGVQAVLIGGGLVLSVIAGLSVWEARAVDRIPRLRDVAYAQVTAADEPISPNP